jgi:predicted nuclease of restriction endonuclease-like (RecB) superfamily
MIVTKQEETKRGDKLIEQVEKDLKLAFPDTKGFSRSNLFYMKKMYLFFDRNPIVQPLVGLIPRTHLTLILNKVKKRQEAEFYISKTIENGRSKVILDHQIDSQLYQRSPNLSNNFAVTLSTENFPPLQEHFKERYILDFLDLSTQAQEKELEEALTQHITQFLIELGKGFAFVGKQYKLEV